MTRLINWIAPFTSMKTAIIDALLSAMPEKAREIIIDRMIAKHLPAKHLKFRPYKLHPKWKVA